MREYARFAPQFWTRGSGKKLRGDCEAQVLAAYVVTCPASNMIGIYYCSFVTIAHETGLGEEKTRAAFGRLAAAGFAFYDEESEFVWVPNMASYQLGEELKPGDKRRAGVLAELKKAGSHGFVVHFYDKYGRAYQLEPANAPPSKGVTPIAATPSKGIREVGEESEAESESESESEEVASPEAPPVTATRLKKPKPARLTEDWEPSAEQLAALREKFRVDPTPAIFRFKNYWLAEGGKNAWKLDWSRTFANWVERDAAAGKLPAWIPPAKPRDAPTLTPEEREKNQQRLASILETTIGKAAAQ